MSSHRGLAWIIVVACAGGISVAAVRGAAQGKAATTEAGREFNTAVELYRNQEFDQAEHELAPLLRQFPDNFQANELMGLIYTGKSRPADANVYLTRAVKLNPGSAEARAALGANLVQLHRDAEAEATFAKAVQLDPGSYEANHNMGEFYIRLNRLREAIPYLAAAERIRPSAADDGYDLALAEIDTAEYGAAQKSLTALLARAGAGEATADLHSLLGAADEHTGQYINAVREYQIAARMDPSEANIFAYGSELLLHDTLDAAEQVFRRGIELYPHSARMQVGFGIALYSRGIYGDAIEAFCRAIDINPADPRPYNFLGKIYDVSPLQAAAVTKRFARFAALEPRNPEALYYYAMSLWKGSRFQNQALDLANIAKLLERAILIQPGFADAHLQLGVLYSQQKRWRDAITQFDAAIRTQPNLADAHYRLAQALVRTGDRDRAEQELALFNRLHAQQVKERAAERSEIKQFVYTAGSPGQPAR